MRFGNLKAKRIDLSLVHRHGIGTHNSYFACPQAFHLQYLISVNIIIKLIHMSSNLACISSILKTTRDKI